MTEPLIVRVDTVPPYDVVIAGGLLDRTGSLLARVLEAATVAVVADETVADLYLDRVEESITSAGFRVVSVVVPPGEASKSWSTAGDVLERLAAAGVDRRDAILALGGGVIGDLAGFCAATYMRGITFAQAPTTLLAQVDSSVGGKTGVDLAAGKNLAGAFIQPAIVVADTAALMTLPAEEWSSGLAEVAKNAVLDGEESLSWIESAGSVLVAREPAHVAEAVRMSVAFKGGVVARDEREAGPRESLNLGHTLAHALEKVAGYGSISHGRAVAEGVRFAARLGERIGVSGQAMRQRQEHLLDALGLERRPEVYDADELRSAMSSDKKARGGRPRFVFAVAPGEFVVTHVEESVLAEELESWARGVEGS